MKPTRVLIGMAATLSALSMCPFPARAVAGLPSATSLLDCAADDGSHTGGTSGCAIDYSTAVVTTAPFVLPTASAAYVASTPASALGFAEVIVNTPRSSTSMVIRSSSCADSATSFAGTLHVDALAGETVRNTMSLEIEAMAGGYADIPANSASASADPRICVDPGFVHAGAHSIVLSGGDGNGFAPAPKPEPGTLALMPGGLAFAGGGGTALRRPRRA